MNNKIEENVLGFGLFDWSQFDIDFRSRKGSMNVVFFVSN